MIPVISHIRGERFNFAFQVQNSLTNFFFDEAVWLENNIQVCCKVLSFVVFIFIIFVTFCFDIPHVIECSTCVRPSVRSSYCRLEFKLVSLPSACTVFKLPEVLCRWECLNFIAFLITLCIDNTLYFYLSTAKKVPWSMLFLDSLYVR